MSFKEYTGWEYLLIDAATNNGLGHDKKTFEERIQWTQDNLNSLEDMAEDRAWKEKPLYLKAVQAIRKAQQGIPTGHMVGLDASASGMQIMAVLTGCEKGSEATGLVDPNKRADAYTACNEAMSRILGYQLPNQRDKTKQSLMTAFYGSKAEPKKEFGDGTPELMAFYQAMYELAPGPTRLLDTLLDSWQPWVLAHEWKLPDGFLARVKVMQKRETRIEVDELNHSTFTYVFYENEGEERGVKNAANIIHSIDGYVLRSLVRRCNYDPDVVREAQLLIQTELLERSLGMGRLMGEVSDEVLYYMERYMRSGNADTVILPHLDRYQIEYLDTQHLQALSRILETMLEHKPFPVITVHDCFAAHPNNLNSVRKHYRNILAELADSNLMQDILSQIHGAQGTFQKLSGNLSEKVRKSAYALC